VPHRLLCALGVADHQLGNTSKRSARLIDLP
jgi:hypothetical protein